MLNPETVISGCLAGFFLNSASVYWFYAALKWTKSETFMAFRVFQPILTYTLELLAALFYAAMKPELSTKDFFYRRYYFAGLSFDSYRTFQNDPLRDFQKFYHRVVLLIFLINVAINIKSFVFLQENMKETLILDWARRLCRFRNLIFRLTYKFDYDWCLGCFV